jgi:arabinan endo-1,5-alpha-L-arabinosidase
MVPATLKRGGNFIDIEPSPNGNFAELDRIDFLRVIRDTIPANGFDNGIRVRLTKDDELAIKDGGYAIYENVVTDSIKSLEVSIEVKSVTGGKLSIRDGKKDGTVLSECELVAANAKSTANGWTQIACSDLKSVGGVKDFYLTASGVSGEVILKNIVFASAPGGIECTEEPCGESSSSGADITSSSSSTTAIAPRVIRQDLQQRDRKGYSDLKGRSFDKQIRYRVMF